jgi:alkylation response protein AidB-like acyl-CoA dehydrogenase
VLSGYAPQAVKDAWLGRIASGEALVVLAHQERKARYRLDAMRTPRPRRPAGWTLSGTKSLVPAGDQADAFLVPAMANGKMALFLVERSASGVTTRGYITQDGSRAAEVTLNNAPATLVTTDGQTALEHAVDIGIAASVRRSGGRDGQDHGHHGGVHEHAQAVWRGDFAASRPCATAWPT